MMVERRKTKTGSFVHKTAEAENFAISGEFRYIAKFPILANLHCSSMLATVPLLPATTNHTALFHFFLL